MRHNEAVFAQYIIMAEMYKVINFGTGAYNRAACGSPVDTGIAADFNLVLQHNIACLQNKAVFAGLFIGNIAEAVAANYSAGLQNNLIAQHAALADSGAWIEQATCADLYVSADIYMRVNNGAITDFSTLINVGKRHNRNIFAYFRAGGNICFVAYNTFYFSSVAEQLQKRSKSGTWVFHPDYRAVIGKRRVIKTKHHNACLA